MDGISQRLLLGSEKASIFLEPSQKIKCLLPFYSIPKYGVQVYIAPRSLGYILELASLR